MITLYTIIDRFILGMQNIITIGISMFNFSIPESLIKLIISLICGLLIGLEREAFKKPAGLRTYALVCLGSTIFTMLSKQLLPGSDPTRIAAQIVTGIGFLGAGVIWKNRDGVAGLTTAAGLWVTAAIGMAIGFNFYVIAITAVIIVMILLLLIGTIEKYFADRKKK